jgi:cyclase
MYLHSRRGFLKRTLGACWTGAALLEQSMFRATHARAQATTGLPTLFDIEKVADGVYAALARPQVILNCNAAIFENASDLLIIDTHSKPSAVAALVAQIRRDISTKPVRYIVNSHFHWDHTQGTAAYRRIAPHAAVVSSVKTRELLSENGAQRLKASADETARSIETYKAKLAVATNPADKQSWQRAVQDSTAYLSEMRNYTPELPDITFDRDLVIHDKAHDLHLAFRGRAHTAGDVVLFCPQKKVIATGDMLHGFRPFIADGYPSEWVSTLHKIEEFPFDHVIGGHGGVQHSRERLRQKANYIEELIAVVRKAKEGNISLAAIQRDNTPEKLKSLQSDGYGEFLMQGWRKYTFQFPGQTAAAALAASVAQNIGEIYANLERS